jgi:hypothetical protein
MAIEQLAFELARGELVGVLPRRWRHVQAVAARATQISWLPLVDQDQLIAAAWLHDIGYAPAAAVTGFHPLDGGRYLRRLGSVPERIIALVAHHSSAITEADERGLADDLLAEFEREESPTADALWYADMTTGPDGQHLEVSERLDEIRLRYGPEHVVTRFIDRAQGDLVAAVQRTQARIAAAGRTVTAVESHPNA